MPEKYKSQANDLIKGTDTLDVWFDSGCSWKTLLKQVGYKADIYLEGNDQHRGWFQSSYMTSLLTNKTAPFKNIITHGFTLDVQVYLLFILILIESKNVKIVRKCYYTIQIYYWY